MNSCRVNMPKSSLHLQKLTVYSLSVAFESHGDFAHEGV